jgi:hypothetical protein
MGEAVTGSRSAGCAPGSTAGTLARTRITSHQERGVYLDPRIWLAAVTADRSVSDKAKRVAEVLARNFGDGVCQMSANTI